MYKYDNKGDEIICNWLEKYQKPLIIIIFSAFLFVLMRDSFERKRCNNICIEKEYASFRFVPRSKRFRREPRCMCLTQEEAELKNRVPQGTRVLIYVDEM